MALKTRISLPGQFNVDWISSLHQRHVRSGVKSARTERLRLRRCESCRGEFSTVSFLSSVQCTLQNSQYSIPLCSPKALLLHLKRFVLVEKPIAQQVTVDAGENAEAPKRKAAVEMAIRKNKVRSFYLESRKCQLFCKQACSQLIMWMSLFQAPVILNPTISLGPIVSSDKSKESDSGDSMATYDVKSVSHHIGGTAWSGHYTCDAIRERDPKATSPTKEPDETWVSFDDGLTSATTADQVLNSAKSKKTAYMLLYTLHA
jgi:hypothetical protein